MALSIKTQEADELARALAARTKESLTDAVTRALRERLQRVEAGRPDIAYAIDRLTVEFQSQLDPTVAEPVEYDADGIPT